jgi:phosphatidylserine/phosphatidylglycerophosphate/cardiolipin synthase-like enzyme
MIIIDRTTLYVLSFNFTHVDIDHSRAFGLVTQNRPLVQEAMKLFEADTTRQPYTPSLKHFIVSPVNARQQLSAFLKKAKKQLLIYDPKIADREMLLILSDRAKAGVEIKIIGKLGKGPRNLAALKLARARLHTRTIVRDGHQAFIGSQSLRRAELDSRREVGLIVHDPKIVRSLIATFEADWAASEQAKKERGATDEMAKATKIVKKAVKGLINDLPPLAPIVKEAVKEVVEKSGGELLNHKEVQETVKEAVKEAVQKEEVKDAIKEAIKEVVGEPKQAG